MSEVDVLEKRIEELEQELRSFKYVNEELVKAVNSGKYRQMLNMLLKKSQEVLQ